MINKSCYINCNINSNLCEIKSRLKDCDDIVYRTFNIGNNDLDAVLIYIDGMSDKTIIDEYVLMPLINFKNHCNNFISKKEIKNSILCASNILEENNIEELVLNILSGDTILIVESLNAAIVIETKQWPSRNVTEPSVESNIKGSKDSFIESLKTNVVLVRRRIKDSNLKIMYKKVGNKSNTDIAVLYIENIADSKIIEEVNKKIDSINTDLILDCGQLQEYLEENQLTPFPEVQATERPDTVASSLYDGRVAIIIDNSPMAVIVPVTITALLQAAEDYYTKPLVSSFTRSIRFFSGIISFTGPAFYIAITSFHPDIIPAKLALFIAGTREGVPFPAFIEAIFMEITFEILREAGVRLPRVIGTTSSIVGGIVIGQAAVSAHIVSPIMIIVVSITAICSFIIPNYELVAAFRIVKFLFIIMSSLFGLYGIIISMFLLIIHLSTLKSYGVPYLTPISPPVPKDLKDAAFLKLPQKLINKRPRIYGAKKTNKNQ